MDKDKQKTSLETWNSEELGKMNQNATNAAPGAATTSQEAPEEGFQAKTVYEGGLDAEGSETAAQGPREGVSEGEGDAPEPENDFLKESEQKQAEMPGKEERKTKRSLMVLVLLLVLTVAAVAVWWFWGHREEEQRQDGSTGQVETGPSEEQKPETELVELSVDDELVQRLYGRFDAANAQVYLYPELFTDEFAESAMAGLAAQNILPDQAEYDAELVKQKVKEIFGVDITFEDGDRVTVFSPGRSHYEYSADDDKLYFVSVPSGGSGPSTAHGLYKAEKSGEKLFLYDVVANYTPCYYPDSEERKWAAGAFGVSLWLDDYTCNPEMLVDYIDESGKMPQSDLIEDKDKFSEFKWTFRQTEEGNYVFEEIEKIKG